MDFLEGEYRVHLDFFSFHLEFSSVQMKWPTTVNYDCFSLYIWLSCPSRPLPPPPPPIQKTSYAYVCECLDCCPCFKGIVLRMFSLLTIWAACLYMLSVSLIRCKNEALKKLHLKSTIKWFKKARICKRPAGLELIDGHRRPWPSVPLLLAVMPLKILGYLRPKKGALFPLGRDALAVLCVHFCVAVMPFFQRLVLPFFRFDYSNNFLPIGIQIFEWTENCDPLIQSAEKKCKTKINNRKVTKLPTAKLIRWYATL